MTVLVDAAVWPWRGRRWAHLVSDESHDELHEFAARLGIPRRAFQGDHYDVPAELRDRAIELGATPVSGRELVRRLVASGLRRRGPTPVDLVNRELRRWLDHQAVPDDRGAPYGIGGYELHTHPDLTERLESLVPTEVEVLHAAGVALAVDGPGAAVAAAFGTSTLLTRRGAVTDRRVVVRDLPDPRLEPAWEAVDAWQTELVSAESSRRIATILDRSTALASQLLDGVDDFDR